METVRNGAKLASPTTILTADVGEIKQRVGALEMRFGAVETKLGEFGERIARLETAIEFLSEFKDLRAHRDRDFRLMFGGLVTIAVGLSGMMAKGFGWL
ncbi:MAG: hypothetical protein V4693_15605 [Pseudomonadota bacterium]